MSAPLRSDRPRLIRHIAFGVSLSLGLGVAAFFYLFLAISECLPRDASAEMHACDAIKQRDFWLYPVLLLIAAIGSLVLHRRGAVGTWFFALTSGLIAALILTIINELSG